MKFYQSIFGFFFFLWLFSSSCRTESDGCHDVVSKVWDSIKETEINKYSDSLKNLIIKNGDINAYQDLSKLFAPNYRIKEILFYSLFMANSYNNAQAHYYVYRSFSETPERNDVKDMNENMKNFALYYLIRSYELGYNVEDEIEKELGSAVEIPKSETFLSKKMDYNLKTPNYRQ